MQFERILSQTIIKNLAKGKVLAIYGPRQVGKTTLIKNLDWGALCVKIVAGDDLRYASFLASQNSLELKKVIGESSVLIIDEAQRVTNIGVNLKLIVDNFPEISVIATGSASFDLANRINEPLTGRKITYFLYPLCFDEVVGAFGESESKRLLEDILVWGSYPQVLNLDSREQRETYLTELVGSYLYRDILEFEGVKKSEKVVSLLRLLAYQIGRQVSVNELGSNLNMDTRTVNKYLDLLEKTFVIYHLGGFSRNLRKEIAKTSRYYFYDNGVRNALINNFNSISVRGDLGQLWENFLMVERRKTNEYKNRHVNDYFWRTYDKKEIDLIEEGGGKLTGFEFKWKGKTERRATKDWLETYAESSYSVITSSNFRNFLKIS